MRKPILLIIVFFSCGINLYSQSNGFLAAYDSMHQRASINYAFGEWKGIDWTAVNNLIRPRVISADLTQDTNAFYLALREYVAELPDGHVSVRGAGWDDHKSFVRYRQIGGSYGFALASLDDGRIVVRLVNPDSPAAQAGMKFGAVILEVNDRSAREVIDTVSTLWSEMNPATREFKKLNQYRFIGRAPVGKLMKVKFMNRDAANPVTAVLTAVDDNYKTFDQTTMIPMERVPDPGPYVFYKLIEEGNYGYLKITMEGSDSASIANIYCDFRDAIMAFNNAGVRGMVLDMRVNTGGADMLSAALTGFFRTDTILYEYWTFYNPGINRFDLYPYPVEHFSGKTLGSYINPDYPVGALFVESQDVCFSKPVMVLVSPRNISSGEGIPMMLQRMPGNKVIGFNGTNGSFGLIEWWSVHYLFRPPNDLYFRFPVGQSVDKDFKVQLDSDSTMTGGVYPDIRVPLNDDIIDQLYLDSVDVELKYAIRELDATTGIIDQKTGGPGLVLESVFPNPVRSSAVINYHLAEAMMVRLAILDNKGRIVKTLLDGRQDSGSHSIVWSTQGAAPGIYFYRLESGKGCVTRKCILIE